MIADPKQVELFAAVTVDEMLERGAQGGSQSRGDWHECSYSNAN